MATLKDVANIAGVGITTISRLLNNDPNLTIRAETRERILQAIKTLNYVPNHTARSLKLRCTFTIGIMLPDLTNPVYPEIIRGIDKGANEAGYQTLLCQTNGTPEKNQAYASLLMNSNRVDGLILATAYYQDSLIEKLQESGIPFVLVNRRSQGAKSFVVVNDQAGSRLAVTHLIELGHRRIAHLAGPLYADTSLARLQGYRLALQDYSIPFNNELVVEAEFTPEAAYAEVQSLLELTPLPTAIFAANNQLAIGTLMAVKKLGLKVPEEISVVGFHDVSLLSWVEPPLTTVRMPMFEMGYQAAKMLVDILQGRLQNSQIIIPTAPELVIRASTCPPRT